MAGDDFLGPDARNGDDQDHHHQQHHQQEQHQDDNDHESGGFGEIMIYQGIHTIEYVLGSVNLRLNGPI